MLGKFLIWPAQRNWPRTENRRRLCIWEPDENTAPTTETPHPFRLRESIQTAHRANIFSAKFLPQAGHPTIASVAGDSRVMVYDVERLGRSTHMLNELDGRVSMLRAREGESRILHTAYCHRAVRGSVRLCAIRIGSKGKMQVDGLAMMLSLTRPLQTGSARRIIHMYF